MSLTIEQLIDLDRSSPGPWIVEPTAPSVGGVDPLGLRQINFDLMDRVFPGLNNVARHIRPFTVVAWAWRRTRNLAVERELALPLSTHEDFVARIEVAFVWSLILSEDRTTARDIDLPGKQRVSDYMAGRQELIFGDDEWHSFVKSRRNSTALTAAINYGPGLRAFKILGDDNLVPGLRAPYPTYDAALNAFERKFAPALIHPVFNGWDSCSITAEEAHSWQQLWDVAELTDEERICFRDRLVGEKSTLTIINRHAILRRVFCMHLPPIESPSYMAEWSKPESAGRLKKMANSIASFARQAKRQSSRHMGEAIESWERDLKMLHDEYYVGKFGFGWPMM
jgi:hypothetical protein